MKRWARRIVVQMPMIAVVLVVFVFNPRAAELTWPEIALLGFLIGGFGAAVDTLVERSGE